MKLSSSSIYQLRTDLEAGKIMNALTLNGNKVATTQE